MYNFAVRNNPAMNTSIPTAVLRSQANGNDNKMALIRKIRTGAKGPNYKSHLNTRFYAKTNARPQHWFNKLLNKIKSAMPSGNSSSRIPLPEYGASNYLADDFYKIFGLNIAEDSNKVSKGKSVPSYQKKKTTQTIPLFI